MANLVRRCADSVRIAITKAKIFIQGLWKIKLDWSGDYHDTMKEEKVLYEYQVNNLKFKDIFCFLGQCVLRYMGFPTHQNVPNTYSLLEVLTESDSLKLVYCAASPRWLHVGCLYRLELSAALHGIEIS
ncbi:hypothetical protein AVEN_141005-1 [Araneus ventricosus]|uniref:Uncharacterized protein n=1 Tax=Araneus ventricosus TaxID=182803 RepID=A0A4Y2L7C6_ARAVE|nr:hypothetical protein AVEN_141005-1 [Araneus ventricosus]